MKIGLRITLLMVAMNIFSIGAVGSVLLVQSRATAGTLAGNFTLVRARELGSDFESFIGEHWHKINALAASMGEFELIPEAGRRAFINATLRGVLDNSEHAANVWSIWEPNALGSDAVALLAGAPGTDEYGRFVPGYVRNRAGEIVEHLRRDFDGDEFYVLPRISGRQIITDPYDRTLAGEDRNVATISAPIRNSAGAIVGVIGLDLSLARLNEIAQDIDRFFPGTMTMAFSNNGTVVSHPNSSHIGSNMRVTERNMLGPHLDAFAASIRMGENHYLEHAVNGRVFKFYSVPVEISDFPHNWSFSFAVPIDEVYSDIYRMILFAVVICLVMVALVVLLAAFVSGAIARPIVKMASILHDISFGAGDLTVALPETGSGEIAEAAHYFNQTIGKIREMVVAIKRQAKTLSDLGNDLASNMTETASAMNQIASNIQSIKSRVINQSASVTETNATMEQVTVNINKLGGHVDRQSGAVSQASSAIEEMLANIQSVTATLVRNVENVKNLQEASETGRASLQDVATDIQEIARESEGLLEINSVMENIASQTNLLSMNAAIEAAHAGESGRGFAVVADEIRKLAESSSEQSKTIGAVLKKIRDSMDKITRSTDSVLDKFQAIDDGVRTVAEQEEAIRNAMEEQGEGSRQVLSASGLVKEITQQVKGGSLEMLEGSKEVIQESKNLERVTQEITNGINEMALGADEINRAVNNVSELSGRNREQISSLARIVSQFKV